MKRGVQQHRVSAQDLVFLISRYVDEKESADATIYLESAAGRVLLYEECNVLPIEQPVFTMICREQEVTLSIHFRKGNYAATAFGCDLV